MKELSKILFQRIDNNSPIRVWHVILLLTLVAGAIPTPTLPEPYSIVLGLAGVAGYLWANRLIKRAARVSTIDIVLVDRFLILMGWIYPAIFTLAYGMQHGFSMLVKVGLIAEGILLFCLLLGIALHIKSAHKYYHGVKKDELFK